MRERWQDPACLLDAETRVMLEMDLDEYIRALRSICRCDPYCNCTDEAILAAVDRLREHDGHAARVRGPVKRKQNRRTK